MHTKVIQCSLDGDPDDYYTSCFWSDLNWLSTHGEGSNGLKIPPLVHNLSDFVESEPDEQQQLFIWGPQKSLLLAPWYTCCEDQTLIEPF